MPTTRKEDGWMSLRDAAAALGEGRFAVLSRIARGELVAQHIAKRTVVDRESVDAVLASRATASGKVA